MVSLLRGIPDNLFFYKGIIIKEDFIIRENDRIANSQVHKSKEITKKSKSAYLLNEVIIFHNRIIWYLEQQQKQEIFALGVTGVLWAYLLKDDGSSSHRFNYLLAMVPPFVTGVLYHKSHIMTLAMRESMAYLEHLESAFKLKDDYGWIHFYRRNTSNYKKKWRSLFWRGLVAINIVISIIFIAYSYKHIPSGQYFTNRFNKLNDKTNMKKKIIDSSKILHQENTVNIHKSTSN